MRQEELSREFEVLKEKGLAELVVWLRKNFDIKFSVTATASCPVCTVKAAQPYVKVAHPTDESGSSIHPAGFSRDSRSGVTTLVTTRIDSFCNTTRYGSQ